MGEKVVTQDWALGKMLLEIYKGLVLEIPVPFLKKVI